MFVRFSLAQRSAQSWRRSAVCRGVGRERPQAGARGGMLRVVPAVSLRALTLRMVDDGVLENGRYIALTEVELCRNRRAGLPMSLSRLC